MPEFSADDYRYMARAHQLAAQGLYTTHPNPRVGCVLVRDGEIVGEGFHIRAGGPHAEVHALNNAGENAAGATAYVTLEPCFHTGRTPPCSQALIKAGVSRVVVALKDPNPLVAGQGLLQLKDAGIQVASGLLTAECEKLNIGFLKRMRGGYPWVRLKMAMSLDGRTGMSNGESQWITGPDARKDVQRLRARSAAIITGIETVLHDNPSMNVRATAEELGCVADPEQPLAVVLDSRLRMPESCKLLAIHEKVIVFHSCDVSDSHPLARHESVELVKAPSDAAGIRLDVVLQWLADHSINECYIECGATLAGQFLKKNLVDELVIYMAGTLLGNNARGLFNIPGIDRMADQKRVEIEEITRIGQDWRIIARP